MQGLIYTFAADIEAEYPPPGLSPLKASLELYDTDSMSKLEIIEEVGGMISRPAPTAVLVNALSQLAQE
ncbi:MAG: hypothetical protein Q9201_002475, partial [Fulgogasparrea decipioides]